MIPEGESPFGPRYVPAQEEGGKDEKPCYRCHEIGQHEEDCDASVLMEENTQ